MTMTVPPLRIAVATSPALLSESLRALLASEDVEVTIIVDASAERYDLAIGTEAERLPPAELIVLLDPSSGSRGGGVVRQADGVDVIDLADIDSLIRFVSNDSRRLLSTADEG